MNGYFTNRLNRLNGLAFAFDTTEGIAARVEACATAIPRFDREVQTVDRNRAGFDRYLQRLRDHLAGKPQPDPRGKRERFLGHVLNVHLFLRRAVMQQRANIFDPTAWAGVSQELAAIEAYVNEEARS